jgi:uncharacterized protein (TIGR02172 family)
MSQYERIHLEDYTYSGEGGQGVAYTHKREKRLAKLFNAGFDAEIAIKEFHAAQAAYEAGVPTPRPYRLITDGERVGTEYELVEGKRSYCRIISQEPERLEEISLRFARDCKALHAMPADVSRVPSMKARMQEFYAREGVVPAVLKDFALPLLEEIPDTPTFLHGDMQIGNIITDGKRDLWIDIGQFAYGAPEWDLSLCWRLSQIPDPALADRLFHLTPAQLQQHWRIFAGAYHGVPPEELDAVTRGYLPYMVIKDAYMYYITFHQPMPDDTARHLIEMVHAF